jgi:hypothetical protein
LIYKDSGPWDCEHPLMFTRRGTAKAFYNPGQRCWVIPVEGNRWVFVSDELVQYLDMKQNGKEVHSNDPLYLGDYNDNSQD